MDIRKMHPTELANRYLAVNALFNHYDIKDVQQLNSRFVEVLDYEDGTQILAPNLIYCFFKCPSVELQYAMDFFHKRDKAEIDAIKKEHEKLQDPDLKPEQVNEEELMQAIDEIEGRIFGKVKESKLPEENNKVSELFAQVQKTRERNGEKPYKSLDEAINAISDLQGEAANDTDKQDVGTNIDKPNMTIVP